MVMGTEKAFHVRRQNAVVRTPASLQVRNVFGQIGGAILGFLERLEAAIRIVEAFETRELPRAEDLAILKINTTLPCFRKPKMRGEKEKNFV